MPKPDRIEEVRHIPEECAGCPLYGSCSKVTPSPVRNEIDVEIAVVLKRHFRESYVCPRRGGAVVSGKFPAGIALGLQYGAGVKALTATLNTEGMMSVLPVGGAGASHFYGYGFRDGQGTGRQGQRNNAGGLFGTFEKSGQQRR